MASSKRSSAHISCSSALTLRRSHSEPRAECTSLRRSGPSDHVFCASRTAQTSAFCQLAAERNVRELERCAHRSSMIRAMMGTSSSSASEWRSVSTAAHTLSSRKERAERIICCSASSSVESCDAPTPAMQPPPPPAPPRAAPPVARSPPAAPAAPCGAVDETSGARSSALASSRSAAACSALRAIAVVCATCAATAAPMPASVSSTASGSSITERRAAESLPKRALPANTPAAPPSGTRE
mmetsp:Transcript_11851/g.37574  ORF Transcript_11851/g.37574 Transcript_11851/m.37574 type:complete len:241 (-) Transcript_11851:385-1107(-)